MTTPLQVNEHCFVNLPFSWLKRGFLEKFLALRLQPEIGLDGDVLDLISMEEFERVAAILRKEGLSCTLHAPFMDLAPGALDAKVRRVSRERLREAFALIPVFKPRAIVCHLNHEEHKYRTRKDDWLRYSLETWRELLVMAEQFDTPIMLENTFERDGQWHLEVLKGLSSRYARFCLDVGHVHAFARNRWQDWLPELSPWLSEVHLHDNDGSIDQHGAIGSGTIDFEGLFTYLGRQERRPIITLEPHTEKALLESLHALGQMESFRSLLTKEIGWPCLGNGTGFLVPDRQTAQPGLGAFPNS